MSRKVHPATITSHSFDCLHCGAFTTQSWFELYGAFVTSTEKIPDRWKAEHRETVAADPDLTREQKECYLAQINEELSNNIYFAGKQASSYVRPVGNLHGSQCYACQKITVWVGDSPSHPSAKFDIPPNQDLPDDITCDFEEARSIVDVSPRGAAALLRLCIQKLCKFLGEEGANIDRDIASLVKKGLHPIIQRSLDIVRVIGNESVHPGELNISDDRETAVKLFYLVNSIAEQMISHPKTVNELYEQLPAAKRQGIEARDKGKPS